MSRLLLALMCCFAAAAQAGVYKWTDANGKVHYSDQPPPTVEASKVQISRPAGVTAPEAPHDASKSDERRARAQDEEAREIKRKALCSELRAEQLRLENSPSGNALKTGDQRAQREQRIEQNQAALKQNGC